MTFIERSPLLSGRGHLSTVPNLILHCFETVLNGQWKVTAANIVQYILYSNHYSATCQSLVYFIARTSVITESVNGRIIQFLLQPLTRESIFIKVILARNMSAVSKTLSAIVA